MSSRKIVDVPTDPDERARYFDERLQREMAELAKPKESPVIYAAKYTAGLGLGVAGIVFWPLGLALGMFDEGVGPGGGRVRYRPFFKPRRVRRRS